MCDHITKESKDESIIQNYIVALRLSYFSRFNPLILSAIKLNNEPSEFTELKQIQEKVYIQKVILYLTHFRSQNHHVLLVKLILGQYTFV